MRRDHLADHAGVVLLALAVGFLVLRGDDHLGRTDGLAVQVAYGHLALGIWLKIGEFARAAGLAQYFEDLVREEDRGRHERALLVFFRVAAAIAGHEPLV